MPNTSMTADIVVRPILTAAPTASATPDGVDVSDLLEVELVAVIGAIPNIANSPPPSWTFTIKEGDAAAGAGLTAVADTDVVLEEDGSIASGVFATVDAADEDDAAYKIGYVGNKKFVSVHPTAADTPGATPMSIFAVGKKKLTA